MEVFRRYMNNPLRNFNYLIGCEKLDKPLLWTLWMVMRWWLWQKSRVTTIKYIINTHEHHDHVEGNPAVVAATGAEVIAHKNAIAKIPNVDRGVIAGDLIELGSLRLHVLFTPGHTPVHLCLLVKAEDNGGTPVLFFW